VHDAAAEAAEDQGADPDHRAESVGVTREWLSLHDLSPFRRYAIACRKLPELRSLRASFLGRAIHTSLENWRGQLDGFLAKAVP
jgi:hypothetical protein